MTVTTEANVEHQLPAARTKLHDAISDLIDPRPQTTDTGEIRWLDSLYDQLTDAVPGQFLGRSGLQKSQPPMWIDASDLLTEIDAAIRQWQPDTHTFLPICPGIILTIPLPPNQPAAIHRLNLINQKRWRPQDTKLINSYANQLEGWVKRIDNLFAENHTKHLPAPCPACNIQTVYRTDAAGERVRQPALQITILGCECMNCHHVWGPQLFMHLARVLGYRLPEGVLE